MLFVDRNIRGLLAIEWESEHRLARRPHDAVEPEQRRGREDVVRARRVDPERRLVRLETGRGNRGEMHEGAGAAQGLESLSVVGHVRDELLAREVVGTDEI